MFDTIRISVDNLDAGFVERLREHYPSSSLEIKVVKQQETERLSEEQFWELVSLLDWSKTGDDTLVIEPVVQQLAARPMRQVYEFQDMLSEKLHRLDTKAHAQHVGENAWQGEDQPFSADEFLYARCCVVANGKAAYGAAVKDPSQMPHDLSFEPFLRIARKAYFNKTGKPFRYVPAFNMETFANKEGWKD